jgi:glyoxylase-like metal-dependent hydrolase (beta-lactamase superfamily II)
MYFAQIQIGGFDKNFSYFLGDEKSREIIVVDPDNLLLLFDLIEKGNLLPRAICITHEHQDHIAGVQGFCEKYSVPVYFSEEVFASMKEKFPKIEIRALADNEKIIIGKESLEVIKTPGHATGCICYLFGDKLITGDTLFIDGCGRCDFADSDVKKMYESLYEKILKLPQETIIYPGHDYGLKKSATIAEQRKTNKFLKCKNFEEFRKLRMWF